MEEKSICLSEYMSFQIIKDYYKKTENKDVFIVKELSIKGDDIKIQLYIISDGRESALTHNKLIEIFADYLEHHGLIFVDFKYIGTIRRAGYYTSVDTPVFQGIKLSFYNKVFEKKLTLE